MRQHTAPSNLISPVVYSCQILEIENPDISIQSGLGYLGTVGITIADQSIMVRRRNQAHQLGGERPLTLKKEPLVLEIGVELDVISDENMVSHPERKKYISDDIDIAEIELWVEEVVSDIGEVDWETLMAELGRWFNIWDDE